MCEKCELIDYPVAPEWRPCYVPRVRPGRIVVNVRESGEDYFEAGALREQVLELEAEGVRLRAECVRLTEALRAALIERGAEHEAPERERAQAPVQSPGGFEGTA